MSVNGWCRGGWFVVELVDLCDVFDLLKDVVNVYGVMFVCEEGVVKVYVLDEYLGFYYVLNVLLSDE